MKSSTTWLVAGFLVAVGLAAYAAKRINEWAMRPFVYQPEQGYTYGSVNGVAIKVPKREIFMTDYGRPDGSDLPRSEPRTCRSPIQSMTLFLRWPGLVPIDAANYDDFQTTQWKSVGYTQWLDAGFINAGTRPVRLADGSNYLYVRRQSMLDLNSGRQRLPPDMVYQYYPAALPVGLPHAIPVGPRSSERELWNRHVYWDADEASRTVMTLIHCGGGQYDPPRWVSHCTQYFNISEMQMDVGVTYTHQLLPQWRAIQRAITSHFLAYKTICPANSEGTQP